MAKDRPQDSKRWTVVLGLALVDEGGLAMTDGVRYDNLPEAGWLAVAAILEDPEVDAAANKFHDLVRAKLIDLGIEASSMRGRINEQDRENIKKRRRQRVGS